jgi:exodeoxyribonuclease VII small subunit
VPDVGKKSPSAAPEADIPFEEAVKKLESIVDAMESGDLPLETLLQRFEDGTRLVKLCQARLEQAELQIQKLEKDSSGQVTAKQFEKAASLPKNE